MVTKTYKVTIGSERDLNDKEFAFYLKTLLKNLSFFKKYVKRVEVREADVDDGR